MTRPSLPRTITQMNGTEANEAERRRWNDSAWAAAWPKRERLTTAVTDVLLSQLPIAAGRQGLDIGTGGGVAALAAARLVGDGAVVGADISAPLLELARSRGEAQGAANVSFVVADVQRETVPGGPFDVALSQFGVMFFDEPETAFANIRGQLVGGGRLGFACWRAPDLNPWFPGRRSPGSRHHHRHRNRARARRIRSAWPTRSTPRDSRGERLARGHPHPARPGRDRRP